MYLQAKHTSKAAFYLLQQSGIVPSYSCIRKILKNLAKETNHQMVAAASTKPSLFVHDNIKIKYGVTSQRGDNQAVSDNGTAMTLIILPESARAFEDADDFVPFYRSLKAQRIKGTAPQLNWKDLADPERYKRNRTGAIFDILDIIASFPEFAKWDAFQSDKLKRPVGPNQRPHGLEHRLKQFMLPTTNIDEGSYSGNSQVIPYVMKHLELDSDAQKVKLALQRRFPWIGDQLSAAQCRQIQAFLQECLNGYDRWEPYMFIFGGLHMQMALGHSILECHRGSNVGATFANDIILLSRTGLQKNKDKKRPDFHTADEFLLRETEADFRGLFMHMIGCNTSEELTAWKDTHSANDLYALASEILCHHASSGAMEFDDSIDQMRRSGIMRRRDTLLYASVRRAYRFGDVDRIYDLFPELLIYFLGSGNCNYAKELFEVLQLLMHECTPSIR
jgi:hypothetical protein